MEKIKTLEKIQAANDAFGTEAFLDAKIDGQIVKLNFGGLMEAAIMLYDQSEKYDIYPLWNRKDWFGNDKLKKEFVRQLKQYKFSSLTQALAFFAFNDPDSNSFNDDVIKAVAKTKPVPMNSLTMPEIMAICAVERVRYSLEIDSDATHTTYSMIDKPFIKEVLHISGKGKQQLLWGKIVYSEMQAAVRELQRCNPNSVLLKLIE